MPLTRNAWPWVGSFIVPVVAVYISRWTDSLPRTLLVLLSPLPPSLANGNVVVVVVFFGLRSTTVWLLAAQVVKSLSGSSVIELGEKEKTWGMNSTVYADHMIRSR